MKPLFTALNPLIKILGATKRCQHNHIDFRGGYIDYGVRLECRDCGRRAVLPLQYYIAINPVRREEVLRDFFIALLSLRRSS